MKKVLFFLMTLTLLSLSWGGAVKAQETHTVYDQGGTTNNAYVPMHGGYFDENTKTEFVIPAAQLEAMNGGTITSMKFYISSVSGSYNWASTQTVFLKEVESDQLSAYSGTDGATVVYTGQLTAPEATETEFEITFQTPYVYQGGNLLVGIYNPAGGSNKYRFVYWKGENVNGASGAGNSSSSLTAVGFTQRNFLPMTTFTYTPGTPSTCEKPATLEHSSVTTAGATLTWTGGSGTYNLEVKGGSYTDWTSVLSNTSLTTTTLTPLDPETQYQVRVQSVCGEEVSGWKTASFTTPCGILTTFPKTYTFETSDGFPSNASTPTTNQLGNCWRNEATVQNGSYATRVWGTSTTNKKIGSQSLVLPDKGNNTNPAKTMLVFPAMDFTSANGYVVSFWIYRNSTGSNPEGFKVYASDCDTIGANAVLLGHYSRNYDIAYPQIESASGWYYYETAPITMIGTTYIIFEGQSYYGNATYVDDVTIKVAPSCFKPTGLEANNITTQSADLSWTANSSETAWTLYYKKTSDENYTEVSNVTENPYTLPALDHSTNYQFYVVANCSATDNSEASDVKAFATECSAISAVGYSANFDDYTAGNNVLPLCWRPINTTTYNTYKINPRISNTNAYSGSNSLLLYSYAYYSGGTTTYDPQPQYAILPEMTDLAGKQITLQAKGYNASSSFKVGTMSDPTDASTFTEITSSPDNPAAMITSYQEYTFYIPSNTTDHYVAIMIEAANSTRTANGAYIDDIVFSVAPTCWRTQNFAASNVTNESAILTWQRHVMGEETAWVLQYGTDENFGDGTYTEVTPSTNPTYTIENGLAATTTYYVRVKPACDNDGNLWSDTISFETEASCMIPNNLVISDVAAHEASLNWNGNNDSYTLRYRKALTAPVDFDVTYDLENGSMPTGWTHIGSGSAAYYNGYAHSTSHSIKFSSATSNNVLVLPDFGQEINIMTISYWSQAEGSSSGEFDMGYVTDPTDATTFQSIHTNSYSDDGTTYTEVSNISLSEAPDGARIAFRHRSAETYYYWFLDDIHITASIEGVYEDWVTEDNATKPYPFSGLEAETYYEAQVNGYCNSSSTTTEWSNPISFTTAIACPAPTNLAYSNVAAHTVDLTWNVNGNPTTNYVLTKNGEESNIVVTINEGVASYTLTGLNGETEYTVSVVANCGNDGNSLVSNNVTFNTQVSCAIPTGLAAIDETTSSIKLHWNANNDETAWVVAHKIDGADDFTEVTVAQSDLDGDGNYNLTGLSDGKTYTIKVRANCGETDGLSQWSSEITHATAASCATPTDLIVSDVNGHGATISWTDAPVEGKNYIVMVASENMALNVDFENNSIPSNFTNDTEHPWYVYTGTDCTSKAMRSNNTGINNSTSAIEVTVNVTEASTLSFDFWSRGEGTDANDWDKSKFYIDGTVIFNYGAHDAWESYNGPIAAGTHTLKWEFKKDDTQAGTGDCFYVDNIKITAGASAFVEKDPTTATSLVLDDLDPETTYYVKVKGDCGSATSPESNVETFTTPAACNAPTNLTYDDESVTGHTVDLSWTENNGATAWKVIYSKVNIDNSEITVDIDENNVTTDGTTITYNLTGLDGQTAYIAHVKSNCGGIHNDISAESNSTSFTTLPACYPVGDVITSNITAYTVTVQWTDANNVGAYVIKQGDNVLDGTTTPSVVINDHTAIISGLEPAHTYTGGTFKVFADCGTEGMSTGTNVPYFQTEPSCYPVTNVIITGKTANSVTFTWEDTHTPDTYIIKEGENVLTDVTAHSVVIDATNHTATISGLDEKASYSAGTFKVFADCGTTDGQSVGVNVPAFTTPCNPQSITYTMGFETDEVDKFGCWEVISGNIGIKSGIAHGGSSYRLDLRGTTSNMIALPQFTEPTNTLRVELYTRPESTNSNCGKFSIGYLTDPNDASTFQGIDTVSVSEWSGTVAYEFMRVDFNKTDVPADARIVLRQFDCATNYYWYVDDITVKLIPNCDVVSGLTVGEKSANTVALSWTPGVSQETNWKLQYRENGYEDWTTIDVAESDLINGVYPLGQLAAETTYNWQVAADCGNNGISDYTAGVDFTTLEACPAPTALTLTTGSETSHGATITWTAGSTDNERFTVEYRIVGDEDWNVIQTQNYIEETTYTINTLDPETSYQVRVSAVCGTELSGYSNIVEFTTLEACPAPAGLAADNATQNTVDLTWNATDAQTYNVQYRTAAGYDFSFTEGFEGGTMPEGWSRSGSYWSVGSGTGSSSYTGSATDNYNATCFINTGSSTSDMLITPSMDLSSVNNATLSFNYRNVAWYNDINEFRVYYRVNGGDWNQLYENLEAQSSWTTEPININLTGLAANYQIGFECKTGSGSTAYGYGIGIDDVTILGGEYHEAGQWQSVSTADNTTSLQLPNLVASTNYEVQVQGVCDNTPSNWSSSVYFTTEAIPEYTVTFVAGNSGTCNTSELTGVTVELPAATPLQDCENNGWTFAGWTTTELTENTTTAPAPLYEAGTSYTPSASILMYAVYMRTEGEALPASYNLVTEEPSDWSGDYLIAYTTNNVIFNSSQDNLDANNALNVSQYWNGNTIASNATTDAQKVTIAATGNGNYSLRAANGKYFGNTSTSNDLVSRTSPAINNTISLDASGNAVIESNNTYLRLNTGSGTNGRFRYYGSGQQPIQLYRYTSATPVTYAGTPDCSVPVSYNIIVTQVQGATIAAPSTAAAGDEVQLTIVPEDGYALNEWQVTTSTGPVTVTNNSFVMPAANVNVTATLFNVYTVAATAVPANGGTVNGAGSYSNSYNENTEVTLTAAANTGYDFTGWYNGDDQVSPDNSYTFTVTGNVTLEARFAERHTVTFIPGTYGTCTTGSLEGSTVDLSNVVALPSAICVSQGWEFAGWSETSVDETTSAPTLVNTIYSPASDIDLYAVYKKTDAGAGQDTWTMATSIAVGDVVVMAYEGTVKKELTGVSGNIGTATDYTTLPAGTYPLTVEQGYADNSYAFKNNSNYLALTGSNNNLYTLTEKDNRSSWTVTSVSDGFDIKNVSYDTRYLQYNTSSPRFACYTHTQKPVRFYKLVPGDVTTYSSNPNCINSYVITAEANDATYGTVTGTVVEEGDFVSGAEYAENTGITLTAIANTGYSFVNWTKGGETVSSTPTCTLTVTEAAAYVANFVINSYDITANVAPVNSGTVTGAGTYNYGASATLTATANTGYHFVNWTENGNPVSDDATYQFVVNGARDLVANFAVTSADLAWSADNFTAYTMIDFNNWKPTVNNPNNVTLRYGCVEGNVPAQGGIEVDATTGVLGSATGYGHTQAKSGTFHIYAVHETDETAYYDSIVYTLNVLPSAMVLLTKNINEGGSVSMPDATDVPTLTHHYTTLAGTPTAFVAQGQDLNILAESATGYHFTGWTLSNEPLATTAAYTYHVPDAITGTSVLVPNIKAVFDTNTYTLTVLSDDEIMGTANGSTTAKHFLSYEISATPNTGYHFTQWSDGNTQNPRTVTLTENTTYTAEFAVNSYAITTGVLPANSGSVTGAGTYNHFANATLTATATTGYTFTNWTENGVVVNATNPYEFQVTGARELVANFSLNTYAVSASANPVAGGTVTGAGTYNHGATVTMTANPATGYAFVNWTEGGQEVSTNASYTFPFTEGRTLVANFTPISYTVTFNPGTGTCQTESLTGSIESSINIDAVTATPEAICGNQDWVFAGWSTASVGETSQAPAFVSGTEYIPTDNITLYAVYKKTVDGEPTSSTASIDFTEQGYTNGQAVTSASIGNNVNVTFSQGTNNNNNAPKYYSNSVVIPAIRCYGGNTFTVTATESSITNITLTFGSGDGSNYISPDNGDYSNGTWTGNENSVVFTISGTSGNRRIAGISVTTSVPTTSAIYNSNPLCYVYAVNVDQNIEHGSVVADQTTDIVAGTEITLTPTPATGYHFGSWIVTAGNDPVTVENNKFTMPESNVNVSALFWIDTLTVEVNANPTVGGTVSGAGDYEYGDMVTLNATANTGYTFVNWTENNQEVSADATYEFTFNGEAGTRTFEANFSLNSYEITVSANPTAGGNVNGGNTYNHGATANLTANPATGYHFVNWTKDGDVVSTSANYSFTVAEAGAYVANFALNSYTIAATANPTAGGAVSGAGTYNHFDNVTLTATVSNGYDFIGWYRGNDQVATSLEYSFEATEDVTLEARFAKRYTITFVPGSHSSSIIQPLQGSSVNPIDIDAVTANPSTLCEAQDWEFAGWSAASVTETTQAPAFVSGTEYVPTDNITLYAVYTKTEGAGSNTASIDFTAQGYTNAQAISDVAISNNVNVTFALGTNSYNNAPKYYSNSVQIPAIRCYGGNTFTVTATDAAITNITLTFGSEDGSNYISPDNGDYSNGTWTGNENSVTFTIDGTSGNRRIAGMSVTTFSGTITYNSDPECFVYDVVVNPDIEHGTVTANPNTGVIAGTEITLTNTPSEGYHFAGWTVTAGNDPVTVENNKFLMPESDVNVTATFEPDTFTLTINYSIVGGGDAPQSYSDRLPFGTPYSVNTPVIAGLTPSQEVVSGTMPAQDVTVNVTYSTVPYTLTIHYVYADNTPAANDVVRNLAYNVPYSETSPTIEGYTPDQAVVSGTMGEADLEVTVVYSINSHNLTVNYVNEASAQVAESHTATLNYHDNYSVTSPQVAGYAANKSVVSGTMGDADKTETVTYYQVQTNIVDATNCAGTGTGSLTVTAPTGNFEYSLDGVTFQTETQFANLNAGDYTLYIRPTGEDYNYSGVWTVNSNITMPVAEASVNPFYCLGDEINLSGNGSSTGSEYTYAWSGPNNFTATDINATIPEAGETHSGTYTLTVTNTVTNCVSDTTVEVIVNTPNMNGYLFTIATHGDAYANLVGGQATPVFATPTVQHYLANAGCTVTLSNDAQATYEEAGDYTITWTATDACGNTATTTQVLHIVLGTCPVAADVDGNTYPVVALNNICWMAANLRTTHYSDGRLIPNPMVYTSVMYPDATVNLDMFGYLYDWTAAMDAANGLVQDANGNVQGICPDGWRMPKENEIRALVNDGVSDIFDLRTTDQWLNNFGTNTTGFSLLPAGCYNANSDRFENLHGDAYIWGVGASAPAQPRVFWADCKCYNWQILDTTTPMGYSVRCVRNN